MPRLRLAVLCAAPLIATDQKPQKKKRPKTASEIPTGEVSLLQ